MTRFAVIVRQVVASLAAAASVQIAPCQSIRLPDFRESSSAAPTAPQGQCDDCGVIRSIREIHKRPDAPLYRTSSRTADPNNERVVGAVIVMLPFGPGSSGAVPFVGGVGTPDVQERLGALSYEVTVHMTDGTLRTFERREGRQYKIGEWVRVTEGRWEVLPVAQ